MTYYLLPKSNHLIPFKMNIQPEPLNTYVSHSLFYFYRKIEEQMINNYLSTKEENNEMIMNDVTLSSTESMVSDSSNCNIKIETITSFFHPYDFIFKKIPNYKLCLSKLKCNQSNFYNLCEILKTIHLLEGFHKKEISVLNISNQNESIQECFEFIRESYKDTFLNKNILHFNNEFLHQYSLNMQECNDADETNEIYNQHKPTFDFIYYEVEKEIFSNTNEYILSLIKIVIVILNQQKNNGCCIIKIENIFFKPVLDIIYLLSTLYEKTYIIKPIVNDTISFQKYLVCKNFITDSLNKDLIIQRKSYYDKLIYYMKKFYDYKEKNENFSFFISSLIDYHLPSFFLSKINDINVIIGQQQLDAIQQIILFLKNKNKDKLFQLIKINIYKSIKWCEKFKIPFHPISYSLRKNQFIENS